MTLEAIVRPEPEPLHHAGPKTFDQRIGLRDQLLRDFDIFRLLQIERDRAASARQKVEFRLDRRAEIGWLGAIDADDIGAHVGEQHAAERPRADAGELDDLYSFQRTHGAPSDALLVEWPVVDAVPEAEPIARACATQSAPGTRRTAEIARLGALCIDGSGFAR